MVYLFFILGIVGLIVNANSWFIIPNIVIYVCFGIGAIMLTINIISFNSINKKIKRW